MGRNSFQDFKDCNTAAALHTSWQVLQSNILEIPVCLSKIGEEKTQPISSKSNVYWTLNLFCLDCDVSNFQSFITVEFGMIEVQLKPALKER